MIIRCYCMYNICNSLTGRKSANHLFKVRAYHAHDEIHTGDLRSFTSVTTVDSCRTWFFSRVLMFYTFRPSSVLKAWWSNKHTGGLRDPPSVHLYCKKGVSDRLTASTCLPSRVLHWRTQLQSCRWAPGRGRRAWGCCSSPCYSSLWSSDHPDPQSSQASPG